MSKIRYYTYPGSHPSLVGSTLCIKDWAAKVHVSYSCMYSRINSTPDFWAWVDEMMDLSVMDTTCGYKYCDNPANSTKEFCCNNCKNAEYKRLRTEEAKTRTCRYKLCNNTFPWDPKKGPQMYCSPECSRLDASNHLRASNRLVHTGLGATKRQYTRERPTRPEECTTCAKYVQCLDIVAMREDTPWPIEAGMNCYEKEDHEDISKTHGRLKSGGMLACQHPQGEVLC